MQPEMGWKLHITRQLKHRDRTQKVRFQELIQSYNKLLEKSSLLKHLTETLQTEQLPRLPEEIKPLPDTDDDQKLILQQQKQIEDLANANRELAVEAIDLKKQTHEQDVRLHEQLMRIEELTDVMATLQQDRFVLEDNIMEVVCANSELKHKYDTMLCNRQGLEYNLLQAEALTQEKLEDLVKKREEDARNKNQQNDRRKKAMLLHQIKMAMRREVRSDDIQHSCCASEEYSSEDHVDKPAKRSRCVSEQQDSSTAQPDNDITRHRSLSLVASGSYNFMGAIKNMFKRERTDSYSGGDYYPMSSVCVICCLPTRALDSQDVHESEVHAVMFSPNSRMVATGGADRVIKIWDIAGRMLQVHQTLEGSSSTITSIEFDPSGYQVLAASYNGAVHLWKLDGRPNESLTGHTGKVTAAKFTMLQHRVVTCSLDRTIREWDLQKAACIRNISTPSFCSDVVCSDYCIVSGHHDKKIRFWDSRSEGCCREISMEEKITSLCLSQDLTQLLSCSRDDVLNLIDMRSSNIRQEFRADGFKCGCDWTKAILSPDGSYSTAGSADGTIFIWNTRTGSLERTLDGHHNAAVNAVTWSMSGTYLVSVDLKKKAVLWSEY
ncbi:protein Atg16l2 isoform X2 [Bombina bombina]|uniref:protein Atg16l2 isoform X2 n=1 Tax=Bombina bombina TaxID=8345 RepID=UPI00235A81A9|nr:protein Atg16l2 isoform X2 [Bombina bombina]